MLDQDAKPRKKPFARLLADLKKRYPSSDDTTSADHPKPVSRENRGTSPATHDPKFEKRIGKLPREAGVLLIVIGVAGLLLPGPVGSPFVLAGGLALWPQGFGRLETWFGRRFPRMHGAGVAQIDRFLGCLEHRYPGATT